MSRSSMPYGNAMAESFFATLKLELMEGMTHASREQAGQAVFEYSEIFYNRTRVHSSLGYRSPDPAERDYTAGH